jgi:sugar phosphate isomerase/epimerase
MAGFIFGTLTHIPMYFCIRREIDYSNSDDRLSKLRGVPIELAFPQDLAEFLKDKDHLADVERQVKGYEVPVYSVHAPDGHLADGNFIDWAGKAVQFAEAVGSGIMVLHPEAAAPDSGDLDHLSVVENIRHLQERTQVVIAMETFWDKKRILTPDQIMNASMPMVLDTSRLPKSEIMWVIETYHTHIVNLHLSAVTRDHGLKGIAKQYQPVERDNFCLDLLDRLQELEWDGVVTLEYMPWLHAKVLEDRLLLDRIYGIGRA